MRDRLENIDDILVPAIGLSSLWPFFRASHLSFLTVFDVQPSGIVQSCYAAYAVMLVLASALLIASPRWLVQALKGKGVRLVMALCGMADTALLWLPAGQAAAALRGVGSIVGTVFQSHDVPPLVCMQGTIAGGGCPRSLSAKQRGTRKLRAPQSIYDASLAIWRMPYAACSQALRMASRMAWQEAVAPATVSTSRL